MTLQGQFTYRITDPQKAAALLNFTIDPRKRVYLSNDPERLPQRLTVEELRRLLPETRELSISRYELPNLGAVNFVLQGLLGTGATSTLRLDAQAKALGEWLRSRSASVPRSLVKT